ncbi:PP2C family protein-serine/threonine phosphatase [Microbispora rosea]|uniref:PP2C family protein-serine/threonine phosphatase n=1 Tax=Microbispora rosea TaxID=58117 RepID=UPI0037BC41F7
MPLTVDAAARTDVGLVRQRNEDTVYAGRHLFAVADGLGGHVAGDIASATAVDALKPYDRQSDPANLPTALGRAVHAANEALRRKVDADPDLEGMGTTLVALLWSDRSAVVANVGDSRVYVLRRGASRLVQLTEDHTYGNLVADAADVPHLPARISRFLDGRADGRSPDLTARTLQPGDRFLLCSDGLSGVVGREQLRDILSESERPAEAVDRLVAAATDHGGPDNISVIVIDVRDGQEPA